MNFKKWVKSIQTAGYNGARTVLKFNPSQFDGKKRTWFLNAAEAEVDEDKYGDRRSC